MYNMSYGAFEVGTAAFRESVSEPKLRRLLAEHRVVEVGRYREPVAIVLDPAVFAELAADHDRLEQLRGLVPLLVAAMSTGAALPSETLAKLGVDLADDSWQTLNELQHRFPLHFTRDADGAPLTRGALRAGRAIGELDEELVGVDD
jgi:hypothetical protein